MTAKLTLIIFLVAVCWSDALNAQPSVHLKLLEQQESWKNFREANENLLKGDKKDIDRELNAILPSVKHTLRWSSAQGVLLHVIMQQDVLGLQPPRFLAIDNYGPGESPKEALILGLDKPRLHTGMDALGTESTEASYFIWVRKAGRAIKIFYMPPILSGEWLRGSIVDTTAREAVIAASADRDLRDVIAMAAEGVRVGRDAKAKKMLSDAAAELKQADARIKKIDSELAFALAEQERIKGSLEWVDRLEKVIGVAQLASHVTAMVDPPPNTANDLKSAKSGVELKQILTSMGTTLEFRTQTLSKAREGQTTIYEKRTIYIKTNTREAPILVVPKN